MDRKSSRPASERHICEFIMRGIAVIVVLLSMVACAFAAESESRELEELELAKQAYEAAVEKARDKLTENIEKQIASVAKSGKLNVVTELQEDRDRFKSDSVLPESTYLKSHRIAYEREVKTATTTLSRAYDRAIAALTKKLETDQAQSLKAEQEALLSRLVSTPKAIKVKASINWQPTEIQVTEGQFYRIQAKGKWRGTNKVQCGPDGMLSKPYEEALHDIMRMQDAEKYVATHPINSLICRIGDESWSFFAGADCRFQAPCSGKLCFAMNDLKEKSDGRDGHVDALVTPIKNQKWIDESGRVRITGFVHSDDELILTAEGIRWKHAGGYERIGTLGGISPVIINGIYWFPQWPNWPTDRSSAVLKTSEFAPNPKRTIQDFKFAGAAPEVESKISKSTNDEAVILFRKGNLWGGGTVSVSWRFAKP